MENPNFIHTAASPTFFLLFSIQQYFYSCSMSISVHRNKWLSLIHIKNCMLTVDVPGCEPYKEYLYTYLKDQTIWHSLRFWNAAFFDALQCERVHRPVVTREDIQHNSLEAITDEKQYQENITFGQLG
jgi:hypothetical protein